MITTGIGGSGDHDERTHSVYGIRKHSSDYSDAMLGAWSVSLPQTFVLPLPPSANHMYDPIMRRNKAGELVHGKSLSDAYKIWRQEAALVVKDWEPPAKTPLFVRIDLYIPNHIGRRADIAGFEKGTVDATVGSRRDQWIDMQVIRRHFTDGEGRAEITIDKLQEWHV